MCAKHASTGLCGGCRAIGIPTATQIIEGHLLPDHVHMCIAIPPKYPVAFVIGFLKGKSAIAMSPLVWQRAEFHGRALLGPWIRSVHSGLELEQVRKYIREQVAAKLVDGPVGESPTRVTCPVAPVVISGGGAGDQSVGSPEVKVLVGWA